MTTNYETIINSNGSKWAGEELDTIEDLLKVLSKYTLDPKFEQYGCFIQDSGTAYCTDEQNERWTGYTIFGGNFFDLSHVFSIQSNDPVIVGALTAAITANRETEHYRKIGGTPVTADVELREACVKALASGDTAERFKAWQEDQDSRVGYTIGPVDSLFSSCKRGKCTPAQHLAVF